MSYIIFDYKCQDCGKIEERMVKRDEMDSQVCECGAKQIRLAAGARTTFKFGDRAAWKSKKAVSFR